MDPLGNMLTKIRNAYLARKDEVTAPISKINHAVSLVLKKEGYLKDVQTMTPEGAHRGQIVMQLRYNGQAPAMDRIRRISKPGRRVYAPVDRIPRPIGGFGTIIVSTPAGVLTGLDAKKRKVGGEVLCEVIRGAQQ